RRLRNRSIVGVAGGAGLPADHPRRQRREYRRANLGRRIDAGVHVGREHARRRGHQRRGRRVLGVAARRRHPQGALSGRGERRSSIRGVGERQRPVDRPGDGCATSGGRRFAGGPGHTDAAIRVRPLHRRNVSAERQRRRRDWRLPVRGGDEPVARWPPCAAPVTGHESPDDAGHQRAVRRLQQGDAARHARRHIGADEPFDITTGRSPALVTFAAVGASGSTSVTTSATGPVLPTGFSAGSPSAYYSLSTTAAFSGGATVCVSYADTTFPDDSRLDLLQRSGNQWTVITTTRDAIAKRVCGRAAALSTFVV